MRAWINGCGFTVRIGSLPLAAAYNCFFHKVITLGFGLEAKVYPVARVPMFTELYLDYSVNTGPIHDCLPNPFRCELSSAFFAHVSAA